jgi:hypothetical protein
MLMPSLGSFPFVQKKLLSFYGEISVISFKI